MKKRYYTYEDFEKDAKKLASILKNIYFKNIYAMPRGGFILGVRLSHLLGIPMVPSTKYIGKDTLIVDDIVHFGTTLIKYKRYNIACLHFNSDCSSFKPRFYAHKTSEYIVYPWEQHGIPLDSERSKRLLEEAE